MSTMRTTRFALTTVSLATGLLLAGCATPGTNGSDEDTTPSTQPQQQNALADFDPCQALSPEEMRQYQLRESQQRPTEEGDDIGCKIGGEEFFLGLYKAEGDGIDYWKSQRSNFAQFQPNRVGDRDGISAVTNGSEGQGICRQIIGTPGGSVWVQVAYKSDTMDGVDPCAKATEIAEQVEPKLPAAQ